MILILFYIQLSLSVRYRDNSYAEIIQRFKAFADSDPDYFILKSHSDLYPDLDDIDLPCGDNQCEFLFAELTNHRIRNSKKPVILLVGSFHGDERLGPNIIIELTQTILKYKDTQPIKQFLNTRLILLQPMVNPYGYYHNQREEKQLDINRDFNYNVQTGRKDCFQSKGAKALATLYKYYVIQSGITFHGGTNVLSWPWGSMNHLINNDVSRAPNSPDEVVFKTLAQIMYDISLGNDNLETVPYILGHMTNTVYALNGAYEDWAYGASMERDQVFEGCLNVPQSFYQGLEDSERNLIYLVEAGDFKAPPNSTYGSSEATDEAIKSWPPRFYRNQKLIESSSILSAGYGNVNRNVFLCLALIDMMQPYILEKNGGLQIGGCYNVDTLTVSSQGKQIKKLKSIPGIWKNPLYAIKINNTTDIEITLTCDSQFKKTINPEPEMSPQSFFMQRRSNQSFGLVLGETQLSYQKSFTFYANQSYSDQLSSSQAFMLSVGFIILISQ